MKPSGELVAAIEDHRRHHAEAARVYLAPHPHSQAAGDRIEARARDLLAGYGFDPATPGDYADDCAAAFAGIHAVLQLGQDLAAGTLGEAGFRGDHGAALLVALSTAQGYLAKRARP